MRGFCVVHGDIEVPGELGLCPQCADIMRAHNLDPIDIARTALALVDHVMRGDWRAFAELLRGQDLRVVIQVMCGTIGSQIMAEADRQCVDPGELVRARLAQLAAAQPPSRS